MHLNITHPKTSRFFVGFAYKAKKFLEQIPSKLWHENCNKFLTDAYRGLRFPALNQIWR